MVLLSYPLYCQVSVRITLPYHHLGAQQKACRLQPPFEKRNSRNLLPISYSDSFIAINHKVGCRSRPGRDGKRARETRQGSHVPNTRLRVESRNMILFEKREVNFDSKRGADVVLLPPSDDRARHVLKVLRCEEGEEIRVGFVNGRTARGKVFYTEVREQVIRSIVGIQLLYGDPVPHKEEGAGERQEAKEGNNLEKSSALGTPEGLRGESRTEVHPLSPQGASAREVRALVSLEILSCSPSTLSREIGEETGSELISACKRERIDSKRERRIGSQGRESRVRFADEREEMGGGLKGKETRVTLLLAMPRPKVMNRLWSVIGQFGLCQVIVCGAEKVERFYFDSSALSPDGVRREVLRGMEQVQTTKSPLVFVHKGKFLNGLLEYLTCQSSSATSAVPETTESKKGTKVTPTDFLPVTYERERERRGERNEGWRFKYQNILKWHEGRREGEKGERRTEENYGRGLRAEESKSECERVAIPRNEMRVEEKRAKANASFGAYGVQEKEGGGRQTVERQRAKSDFEVRGNGGEEGGWERKGEDGGQVRKGEEREDDEWELIEEEEENLREEDDGGLKPLDRSHSLLLLAHPYSTRRSEIAGEVPCNERGSIRAAVERAVEEFRLPRHKLHVLLAVGPEGGWTEREVEMFEKYFGFSRVSLGSRPLRTDVALISLLSILKHELCDFTSEIRLNEK